MWWWTVLLLVLANTLASQPVVNEDDKYRQARELGIECCPCPGPQILDSGLRLTGDQKVDATGLVESSGVRVVDSLGEDVEGRVGSVDECPCRLLPGDSEGSASVFIPRVLNPLRHAFTKSNSNEEPKPLLKPEVKLASSVLDTLKEATDEEYQEAVARDAAKAADKESDGLFDDNTSNNGNKAINVFVNREEEDTLVPEATNIQESRCFHPSRSSFELERTLNRKPHLAARKFEAKSLFRGSDVDNGVSNINENVVGINKGLQGLQLKTSPSILNLFPGGLKPIINRNKGSILQKIPKLNRMVFKNVDDNSCGESNNRLTSYKIPNFKLGRLASIDNAVINRNSEISSSNIPSFRSHLTENLDSDHSPSNVNEHFTEIDSINNQHRLFKSPLSNLKLRPLRLSNLLNLKDVELIPPSLRKETKVYIPSLELPPIKPREQLKQEHIEDKADSADENGSEEIDIDSKENDIKTDIMDVVPSPSEHKPITQPTSNIHILNSLPHPSENQHGVSEFLLTTEKTDKVNTSNENNIQNITKLNNKESVDENRPSTTNENAFIFEDSDSNTIIIIDEDGESTALENIDDFNDESGDDEGQNDHSDYEDSDEIIIDSQSFTDNEFPDAEVDTSNTDFQFALPAETEDENDENFIEQELRSGPNPVEEKSVSAPITLEVSERLQKIKDQIANRLEQIKSRLAKPKAIDIKAIDFKKNKSSNENDSVAVDDKSNCQCKSESSTTVEKNDILNTLDQFENSSQIKDTKKVPKESTQAPNETTEVPNETTEVPNETTEDIVGGDEHTERGPLDNRELKIESTNIFEVSCKGDQASTLKDESKVNAISDEEEASEENSLTEDQEEQPETTTAISDSSTMETLTKPSDKNNKENNANILINHLEQNINSVTTQPEADIKTNQESSCNKDKEKSQQKTDEDQVPEMSVGGSAPEPNVAPMPFLPTLRPLFNNGIVQPSSLINNNIFNTPLPGIGDFLNLDTQLPSLDDVRSQIANALGLNARNVEESRSTECELAEEEPEPNLEMSADTSRNNGRSMLPTLRRPLQDLNLDIFQLRPLSKSRLPGLDLNSFRTHLELPTNLGLKPVKLQSSLRGNGGLLGATLKFGPEKTGNSRKSAFTRKGSNALSSPSLVNIPSLNELRDKMRSNAENLLSSTPLTISTIALPKTPTLGALHENLKSHTENTMRNLQQSLASTLNVRQEKYARPKDALEDFNEKLQALHMDFNDRLTSIHERIFDKAKVPMLRLPLFQQSNNFEEPRNVKPVKESNFRINKPQSKKDNEERILKPFKISKAASSLKPKMVEVPKLVTTSIKPPVFKPLQRGASRKEMRVSTQSTESNQRPTLREQLKTNRENNRKLSSNNEHRSKNDFESTSQNIRKNLQNFEQQRRRMQDSHGFASEVSQTRLPAPTKSDSKKLNEQNNFKTFVKSLRNKPQIHLPKATITKPEQQKQKMAEKLDLIKGNNLLSRKTTSLYKPITVEPKQSIDDSLGFPSERSSTDMVKATLPKTKIVHPLVPKTKLPNLPKPSLSTLPKTKTLAPIEQRISSDSLKPKSLSDIIKESSVTKTTESPFLTRVREALKSRVKPLNKPLMPKTVIQNPSSNDMTISATENREIAVYDAKPLKENVQYRCKMMCVREPAK